MTSLEPGRVVWQHLGLNYRYKDIATCLQIGVGTAHRIVKKFELTGDVALLKRYPKIAENLMSIITSISWA